MMNKLALSALCLGALFQSNCVVEGEGELDVTWQLDPGCPTVDSAVEIHAQNIVTKKVFTDIYNCTDGRGLMSRLPLADYDVWIDVTDAAGGLFAQSNLVAASVDFDGDVIFVDMPTFSVDEASFGLTWSLVDGGVATTCADVFADTVQIEATLVNSTAAIRVGKFDCAAGTAVTDPLALGEYEIYIDILQDPDLLGTSMRRSAKLEWGNQLNDIGNFEFTFQ